jgi:hypothetical protein
VWVSVVVSLLPAAGAMRRLLGHLHPHAQSLFASLPRKPSIATKLPFLLSRRLLSDAASPPAPSLPPPPPPSADVTNTGTLFVTSSLICPIGQGTPHTQIFNFKGIVCISSGLGHSLFAVDLDLSTHPSHTTCSTESELGT